jgi:hypothetical protein
MMINCCCVLEGKKPGILGLLLLLFGILLHGLAGTVEAQLPTFDTVSHRSDLNGDGRSDIFWRYTPTGDTAAWLMNFTGTAVSRVTLLGQVDPSWQIKGIGDFNADGSTDVLWQHTSGVVASWLMNASGTGVTSIQILGTVADVTWQIQGVGDFNADGRSDILWRKSTGPLVVWLMNSTGTGISSIPAIGGVSDPNWVVKGIGDFNADNRFDILWQHTSGAVVNWLMNATGTGVSSVSFLGTVPDVNWTIEGIGDFNGDSRSDVLWRHTLGFVVAWLMNGSGTGIASIPILGSVGDSSWVIKGIGDFNTDFRSDVLWQRSSGEVVIWFLNAAGTGITSFPFIGTVPDPNWSIINFPTGTD